MRRSPFVPFLALLLIAVPAHGQTPPVPADVTPKAVAKAKASYPSGSAVVVNAKGSVSGTGWPLQFKVYAIPTGATQPSEVTDAVVLLTASNDAAIYPELSDGQYFFQVSASAPKTGQPPATDTSLAIVTIGSVTPTPTPIPVPVPDPGPSPTPAPPSPPAPSPAADPLGLTASTTTLLASMTWSNEAVKWRQGTLAPIFSAVASSATTYANGQAMIADLESKYKTAIGPTMWPQWQASLFTPLKAQLAALTTAKKLVTVADLAEAFNEISAAMKGN